MKLKVKRKYRHSKFKKHFKKTYKKKNSTHRVKKHKKNQTKNNRRRSKKYLGGATQQTPGDDKGTKLLLESLMKEIKKISIVNWGRKKSDEKTNCKKLNDLVDEMHKLESSSLFDIGNINNNIIDKYVKVYNMQNSMFGRKEAKLGKIKSVTSDNKVTIEWNDKPGKPEEMKLKIRTNDSKAFTKGKEFMFVDINGEYKLPVLVPGS